MAKSIAIVGAGAKAAAICARAAVLRDQLKRQDVPEIHVFERDHIGAAWSGRAGHSSGFLTLCTPAEKDVGFPYDQILPTGTGPTDASALYARFSWSQYLVETGQFADWVDRGRDHPSHSTWTEYLEWVFGEAGQQVMLTPVTGIEASDRRWRITHDKGVLEADAVVLTGTGRPRTVPTTPAVPDGRIFDAESFWPQRRRLLDLEEGSIAVAGDGGAAGAIVAWLADRFAEHPVAIVVVNPMGTLFSRGDGHAERRWFSDPTEWSELSQEHRRKLLQRTEGGVISLRNKVSIDRSHKVFYRSGKVVEADWDGDELRLSLEYEGRSEPNQMANYLVTAIGFDSWSLLELIDDPAVHALCAPAGSGLRALTEEEMLDDLSLPAISGLPPGVHVPALGGLRRGPGMGNLGSLGLMAARVLDGYLG